MIPRLRSGQVCGFCGRSLSKRPYELARAKAAPTCSLLCRSRLAVGEHAAAAKLTDEQVLMIRRDVADGETKRALAVRYGIADSTVGAIVRGETWRHLL